MAAPLDAKSKSVKKVGRRQDVETLQAVVGRKRLSSVYSIRDRTEERRGHILA
jgi:hypothetical protein